jgi:hypothetical protein
MGETSRVWPAGVFVLLALAAPGARAADVSALFGARVTPIAGLANPVATGDLAGAGEIDEAYLVHVGPATEGKAISADVHVLTRLFGKEAFGATTSGAALAIVMPPPRGTFLVIDPSKDGSGFSDSPSWSDAEALKHPAKLPIHVVKRSSATLKSYPCLRKPPKGDVLMLGTEAGIDIALDWTGATFKTCQNPNDEP